MNEYKPNSHRVKERMAEKEEKKKVEKVVRGKAKKKKKSEVSKLASNFISEDVSSVKDYIIMDVLLPTAKKAISEIVSNGIDMLLYGEVRDRRSSSTSRTSYSKYWDKERDRDRDRSDRRHSRRMGYDYDDIILDNRAEAEEVLDRMEDLIDTYGIVSVADLYDLVGITGNYTDNKYGWTNLRNAGVQRLRDGYLLKLPKALPID